MKRVFGDKNTQDLVFDETPYKTYSAKVTSTATLKYIPFNEGVGRERIYKGEGTIQFTCYEPYAICKKKWLKEYTGMANIDEWKDAAKLLSEKGDYDLFIKSDGSNGIGAIKLWNPGDKESDFILLIEPMKEGKINIGDSELGWKDLVLEGDKYIKINTKLNIVEGCNDNKLPTGNIYNQYFYGDFFKIPQNPYNQSNQITESIMAL
jgi:hypothetical protein